MRNIAVSPDGQHFAGSEEGVIHNKSLVNPRSIFNYGPFTAYAFSEDGTKLYATTKEKLYAFSFPDLSVSWSILLPFYATYLFEDEGKLVLVGKETEINATQAIIQKMDF